MGSDHRGKHVYALSLPVARARYVMMRFVAGIALLALPALALWIGAILASVLAEVPSGLQTYPHSIAVRFGSAVMVAYAVFFSISSATPRTAGVIVGAMGLTIGIQVLLNTAGIRIDLVDLVFSRVVTWPGPFEIFTGRWMLIDV